MLKSGGSVRGVEVGGSRELESGGLGSENLGLEVWGRRSCGWGVRSEKLGSKKLGSGG